MPNDTSIMTVIITASVSIVTTVLAKENIGKYVGVLKDNLKNRENRENLISIKIKEEKRNLSQVIEERISELEKQNSEKDKRISELEKQNSEKTSLLIESMWLVKDLLQPKPDKLLLSKKADTILERLQELV